MAGLVASLWHRILKSKGGRPFRAVHAQNTPSVWVQECTRLSALDEIPDAFDSARFQAGVEQVSQSEIYLLVPKKIQKGALLSIELPHTAKSSADSVLAYVVSSWPREDRWAVTCVFSTELSEDDLRSFGGCRTKPPPPTRRVWSRFPFDRAVTYQPLQEPDRKKQPATAVDISPTGIGLIVAEPVEAGAVLSIEIKGRPGRPDRLMHACVVRSGAMPDGRWRLGCNFIRHLEDTELQAFL
jgi:PilZ domain